MASHALLAFALKTPTFAIEPREAEMLAKAMADLQQFYPSFQIAPKTMAWGNMFSALGLVYGGRLLDVATKKKDNAPKTTADVIRPAQFQQTRPHVTPPPPPVSPVMPDGDDLATAQPQAANARAANPAEQAFAATPPELL